MREWRVYEPEIVHFSAGYTDYFHYRRERARLRMAAQFPALPPPVVSGLVGCVWNAAYACEVFARRMDRRLLRGQRAPWNNWLPVSRYR